VNVLSARENIIPRNNICVCFFRGKIALLFTESANGFEEFMRPDTLFVELVRIPGTLCTL
jgi:hypothetical protein